jgi:hypothetical protein
MKKKKDKSSAKANPPPRGKNKKPLPPSSGNDFGGMPEIDLKKNLGCG